MFVLWPILPLAIGAFTLSVAYEGEIYLQNIKGALNKLFFKRDYLKHHLANEFLRTQFPKDTSAENCPQFFKDYEAQLYLLHQFSHKRLDKASRSQKKQIEKTLRDMEKWFALQLFSPQDEKGITEYESQLREWLSKNGQKDCQTLLQKRRVSFHGVKVFSTIAAIFMGLGTTYLLVEAFSVIPLLAAIPFGLLPALVVPMAIVAGAAYGLLTYNAITDMINNDTLRKWYNKIRDDIKSGLTVRSVFIAVSAVLLVSLAVALTICTAGTWWTVVKNTHPLFTWMGKLPSFVMGLINPLITGFSSLIFNLENTSESLGLIDQATKVRNGVFKRLGNAIVEGYRGLRERENWLQIINPFRLLLKLTFTPLRILLFFGHLISIGVTSDRVPGIPEVISALLGIISEGFEDMHYFIGHSHKHGDEHSHEHELKHRHGHEHAKTQSLLEERLDAAHGHDHSADLPTRLLKLIFSPIYALAAAWDSWASKGNNGYRKELSFQEAWEKQTGQQEETHVTVKKKSPKPSQNWEIQHAVYRIERFKEKHLHHAVINKGIANAKVKGLTTLQQTIRQSDAQTMTQSLREEAQKGLYNTQRFFDTGNKTRTQSFLEELPSRISSPAA